MQCSNCKTELTPNSKFCSQCGTAVPSGTAVQVRQDIGTVKGSVASAVLGEGAAPTGLNIAATQKVDTVESGGVVVGAVMGGEGKVHVGGQQHYGDDVQGDKITTGNITNSTGIAIGHGARVNVSQTSGASVAEIAQAFTKIMQAVDRLHDKQDKDEAAGFVKKLEAEALRGEQADESKVQRWLNFLAGISEDVWDVAVDTLINPIKGIGTVFQKIAKRAKEEKAKKGS